MRLKSRTGVPYNDDRAVGEGGIFVRRIAHAAQRTFFRRIIFHRVLRFVNSYNFSTKCTVEVVGERHAASADRSPRCDVNEALRNVFGACTQRDEHYLMF
jgi:hypothetical protein